jgi:hypothetical protein
MVATLIKDNRLSFQKIYRKSLLWENRNWSWVFFAKFYEKSWNCWSLVWDSGAICGLVELRNACRWCVLCFRIHRLEFTFRFCSEGKNSKLNENGKNEKFAQILLNLPFRGNFRFMYLYCYWLKLNKNLTRCCSSCVKYCHAFSCLMNKTWNFNGASKIEN